MSLKTLAGKAYLKTSKHAPTILVVGGTVCMVAAAVVACKETLTVDKITQPAKEKLKEIHDVYENQAVIAEDGGVCPLEVPYEKREMQKDLVVVYLQTGAKLVKHYAPALGLGALGLGATLYSHGLLSKRNAALGAAYTGVSEAFKAYRSRVREELGADKDYHFRTGAAETVEKVVVTGEDGKKKTTEKVTEMNVDPEQKLPSDYAIFFDNTCDGWDEDPFYSLKFLKTQQQYANDLLQAKGFLFLNDVYEMLGAQKTKAGQIVGWVKDNPNGNGYIDFGLYDMDSEAARRFVNKLENVILLDFNVDGNILDMI